MSNYNLAKRIDVREVSSNIDALYGPYISIESACLSIPINRRALGRTVAILEDGSVTEYWWKSGTNDEDLVQKIEQMTLSLHLVGNSSFAKEEGELITGRFMVNGGASIKKAILYQVIYDNEVFVREYNDVGKGNTYTFVIPNPTVSGTYLYRIKVVDTLDNYAISGDSSNYLEYTLSYGGISAIFNLTQLNSITVKNFNSVAEQPFQINLSVRDSNFSISSVCLTDSTDENSENLSVALTPYVNPGIVSDSYLGNNYYYMPDSSTMNNFNGKQCSIVIHYIENSTNKEKVQNLFRLLDISTLELISEVDNGTFYATLPGYYTFQLQSGVENLSIVLTPGENSDFNFERVTILSYRRFSLKVIPEDIIKDNAQIVIRYRYSYNNIEYSGTFTRTIGNILALPEQSYYEPAVGTTTSMVRLIDSDNTDYTDIEDGQYYKVISDDISTSQLTSSFILDTYCKINQQNNRNIKYIVITYGGIEIASVTEDEISCANRWGNLYTDTPINEWTQIGIGINLQETINRNNQNIECNYHAIYINGMIVKTVQIDNSTFPLEFNNNSRLVVTVGNGILVQKCFLYYRNDGENIISPNTTQNTSIIYNNFKSHKFDFSEPIEGLPVLKFLRINDSEEYSTYFNLINTYKEAHGEDKIVHLTTFGSIGAEKATTMALYDANYSANTINSNATLFRQSVDIKKPAQKEYAVLCRVQGLGLDRDDVIVEVHTQGTSTLVYSIPNFKFTFWQIVGSSVQRFYPEFIQKEGTNSYYEESIYTAKADFMDSSHLNNTPTCTYYNNLIKHLIDNNAVINGDAFTGSPAARNGMLDAIMGFPIVMEISDNASNFNDIFTNIGSFMLNIDKTGSSLGFEVEENGQTLSCISFEGTSNDNDHGAAGRFDIPDGTTLKSYINGIGDVDESEIRSDYAIANSARGKDLNFIIDGVAVRNLPYVKWCKFFSDGLEYRYPDSDIYKEKNDTVLNKIMNVEHFIALYKMWYWVYTSDQLSQSDYKTQFVEHFDLSYCMIYFINLMTYAQTDNLGKNAMFDCWDGEHWYPRPYDLDSEAGLDNNGNDNIATFVEIRPNFSLNYDEDRASDYQWLSDNYLLDEDVIDPVSGDILYPASTIQYGAQMYDRYHFSSNKSKLWINFYKNFKTEINNFYNTLRNYYNYGPETIISLCQSMLIDTLGTAQYNQDFQNKYLANSDQRLAYGNRWYKFKKWITKRFAFCDSYFGATETAMYNLISRINYNVKVDAPQYIAQQYQGESNRETRFVLDNVSFNAGSGAATKITLLVNQPSVFETSLFKYVTIEGGSRNYCNLLSLDVSGNNNSSFTNITSVTGTNLNNLKYLNISNSAVKNLDVPPNLKTLLANNVVLSSFIIPSGCTVEEISLRGSVFNTSVDFSMLPNLVRLDLTDCVFNQNITFAGLPKLEELIMTRAVFNGTVTINDNVNVTSFDFSDLNVNAVSFSGSNLQIDTLNFTKTKFGVSTLNLNAIRQNVRNLYFNDCTGLTYLEITDNDTFDNLQSLSLSNSSIKALGANNTIFDCSHFGNMADLTSLSYNSNQEPSSVRFTFRDTIIERISNLSWTGSGESLFRDCHSLLSITGTLNVRYSMYYMFYRCYALTTLPTINVLNDVTNAIFTFAGTNALSYASIRNIIRSCTNVTDFSSVLRGKQFDTDQVISLDDLFENNSVVTNLSMAFSQYGTRWGLFPNINNNVIITGTIPSTVTNTYRMFYGFQTISIPYNILSTATALREAFGMFDLSRITFTGEGRPIKLDTYGSSVTLSEAIDKTFFSSNLVDISQMFYATNISTNDPTLFANLPNLKKTNAVFGRSYPQKFSFVNSRDEVEDMNLDVVNMWQNNPLIEDISGCFTNIYNVFCTGLNFHNNVDSSKTVNISGIFGINTHTYRTVAPITINLDSITPILKTDSHYGISDYSTYNGLGVFHNRSVTIISSNNNSQILNKLSGDCEKLFFGTMLYLPNSAATIDLTNVTNCSQMFENCRIYTTHIDGINHAYNISDRKFLYVTLPTRCANYYRMFYNSSVLKDLPRINSDSAADLSYMFGACVINTSNLTLPSDYFEICEDNLSRTHAMFYQNKYITELEYSANRGLFENCTNLSNVEYMFSNANLLHKGIPVNLFGSTPLPKIASLSHMFVYTSIFYDVEDNSHKWMNATTIEPLVNLENISEMFSHTRLAQHQDVASTHGTLNQTVLDGSSETAVIAPDTFTTKTITDIRKVFEYSPINPPTTVGKFRFIGFSMGTDAFFSSAVQNIDDDFVDSRYISSIINVDRMFYQVPSYGLLQGSTVNGLSDFVDKLIIYPNISKYNIAGNLVDNNIPAQYTANTNEADSNRSSEFAIFIDTEPERLSETRTGYNYLIYS